MSIRQRVLVGGTATLVVVGAGLGWFVASAPQHAPTQVQVDDTAGVLLTQEHLAALEDVRFHEPTTVGVFTDRGGEAALTDDLALNDAVLEHARQERTEWLSPDGRTWADGLFVLAVDVEGRLVGTYFGEDRTVDEDAQLAIQEASKEDFRSSQWTDGSIAGVEAAADRMNAPVIRRPVGMVVAAVASVLTVLGAGTYLGVGMHRARRSRRSRTKGDAALTAVLRDHEVTEVHARLIPQTSRYGGLMLQRYDDYTRGFRTMVQLGDEVSGIPERDHDTARAVERLAAYETSATSMDHLDDVIADTAALLNRDSVWSQAWYRQVAPVREDLEDVPSLVENDLPAEMRDLPEVQELRRFASQALVELDRLRGDLEADRTTPDDALDRLRTTRDRLSEQLDALAGAVAQEFGKDEDERETMGKSLRTHRGQRVHERTIIATADPTWSWFAVGAFRSGYAGGSSEVEQSRSSSSSGSSSGYSGGGGSFSGAGSSSRF